MTQELQRKSLGKQLESITAYLQERIRCDVVNDGLGVQPRPKTELETIIEKLLLHAEARGVKAQREWAAKDYDFDAEEFDKGAAVFSPCPFENSALKEWVAEQKQNAKQEQKYAGYLKFHADLYCEVGNYLGEFEALEHFLSDMITQMTDGSDPEPNEKMDRIVNAILPLLAELK